MKICQCNCGDNGVIAQDGDTDNKHITRVMMQLQDLTAETAILSSPHLCTMLSCPLYRFVVTPKLLSATPKLLTFIKFLFFVWGSSRYDGISYQADKLRVLCYVQLIRVSFLPTQSHFKFTSDIVNIL
jgi:hypothetical protein